ncbi:MAG: imidazoleglycerol-phosphate dehydratase [Candidatus Omnitrophica bacterium]|nr:imidazoleglycerol-phosphate dehydratase [Candidatus Omnitrophota bacterium]MBI5024063.1 imidazoleglycerol-phosphate dehydratase [Candidatus Omnitrophota bacterium]
MEQRKAQLERKSKETEIKAELNIDGQGKAKIKTHIGLLDHMLELFAFHGCFDLNLEVVKADLEIDIHHTNEDVGIVLGKIFKKALGEMQGIRRFGSAFAPMEDTLGHSVVDISGRGHCKFNFEGTRPGAHVGEEGYNLLNLEHFMDSFAKQLGANMIITINNSSTTADLHTITETVFKSFGLALDQATQVDPRRKGAVPSTKGIID